jgi:uncharacterized protein YecE (DUF72 family)
VNAGSRPGSGLAPRTPHDPRSRARALPPEDLLLPLDLPSPKEEPAPEPRPETRIRIGTSGYSFADWVGPFYPHGTKPSDFLTYYSRHFDVVEVNATYYRIPQPRVLEQMERKTPARFRFVVKLHQSMTHEDALDSGAVQDFRAALVPLREAGKLDALLAQFPWAFRSGPASWERLSRLRDAFPNDPLFVEFRHDSWNTRDLAERLRERRVGFCAVDEPSLSGLMPPVVHLTSDDGYVRFHGRNAATWWGSGTGGGDRYDWNYRREELNEWVGKIAELADRARRTYLFFNNCHAGQAARSAKLMQELLRQQKLSA